MTPPFPSLKETFDQFEVSRKASENRRIKAKRKQLVLRILVILVLVALVLWTYILLR